MSVRRTYQRSDAPGVIANSDAAGVKPPIFAVEAPQALFEVVGNPGGYRFRKNFKQSGEGLQDAPYWLLPSPLALPAIGQNTRCIGD